MTAGEKQIDRLEQVKKLEELAIRISILNRHHYISDDSHRQLSSIINQEIEQAELLAEE